MAYVGPEGTEDLEPEEILERLVRARVVALDTETVSLKDRRLIGLGVAFGPQEALYVMYRPDESQYFEKVLEIVRGRDVHILHNAIFDLDVLAWSLDLETALDCTKGLADTSIMGQVQAVPSVNLSYMAHHYLSLDIQEINDILVKRQTMLDLRWDTVAWKCMWDCMATYRLYQIMDGHRWREPDGHSWTHKWNVYGGYNCGEPQTRYVTAQMKDCYRVDIALVPLLLRMSMRGLGLRPERVRQWYEQLSGERLVYQDVCTAEGFNPGSPQQVGYVLAARGNFLPFTKSKKQLKANEEILGNLADPLARVVLEYRKRDKLIGTYLRPWLDQPRAYTHFRQDLSTMRLSSSGDGYKARAEPHSNQQNIPPPIRDVFQPDNGIWMAMDYQQQEMRIAAYMAQDGVMGKAYVEGRDIHSITQSVLWPGSRLDDKLVRLRAKTFNFAMLYRAEAQTLARHTGLPIDKCSVYRTAWLELYRGIDEWQQETIAEGLENDYVMTEFGRKCRLPSWEVGRPHLEKCAVNYPPQGTGADVIKRAMLRLDAMGVEQALQVHDEVLADGIYRVDMEELAHIHPEMYLPVKAVNDPVWSRLETELDVLDDTLEPGPDEPDGDDH